MGLLNGKVAVVTGAGGGLGRTHALALAKEGAKLVINDLGGSRDGTGASTSMAQQVADEIKKMGGEAVANTDSVADPAGAERIVQAAIKAFGRIDILVNNAGILRDKTLLKMDDEQWKLVMAVHLDGTFYCGRAAARWMSENKVAGRIINTTSYSGLKGNYGQCNYGAAKAGIAALTKIWGLELAKYGITSNAIAPMAKTRMTTDIEAVPQDMDPEQVSPIVVYLASDLAKDVNGRIFGVHGRHIFEYKTEITDGVKREKDWTPSEIASQMDTIAASAKSAPSSGAQSAGAGAASDNSLGGRIKRAFDLMPVAFTADKSAGWNAILHFLIEGADSYTLTVKDKTCQVQVGVHGMPTCKVNVGAETMAAMIEGKTSGQQAFMAGKIKADNLNDMMKFGKVFDFKRAREAAASAPASAATSAAPASGGGDQSLGGRIKRAFDLMPVAFTADKSAGWNAILHFLIEGADSYTLTVKDKTCQVQVGVHGMPTCKVNVGAETMAAMIEGKTSGQQAFMAGKIKADNLNDMMKFGKVFDFKRAREASAAAPAAAAAAAAAATGPANIEAAFGKLADVFLPDQASGWNGKVVMDVTGTSGWTVTIENRKCTVEPGKGASPTCTISASPEDLAQVLGGKMDFNAASTKGLVRASNPMALIKFNKAFDWKSPKLASALTGAGGASGPTSGGGVNPAAVGRKYRSPAVLIQPEAMRKFAAATNDPNPRFETQKDKDLIASPIFPVTLVGEIFRQMLADDIGVDFSRLVHGEQAIEYFSPLHAYDLITPRGAIIGVEKKGSGEVLHFEQQLYRDGELVVRIKTGLFIRGQGSGGAKAATDPKPSSDEKKPDSRKPKFTHPVRVADDQPKRYADASGDHNPIHLDEQIAKAAGFPSVILHGLCTMAFTGQAIVEKALGSDPTKLKSLAVRFSRPVFPKDELTIAVFEESPGKLSFTATNKAGVAVITHGLAAI